MDKNKPKGVFLMKKTIRLISIILATAMIFLCFAGCGKDQPVADPVQSGSSVPAGSDEEFSLHYFDESITDIAYIAPGYASFRDYETGKLGLLDGDCKILLTAEYDQIKFCVAGGYIILTYADGREVTYDPSTGSVEDGNWCAHGGYEYNGWDSTTQKVICFDMDGSTYDLEDEFLPGPGECMFVTDAETRQLYGLVGEGGKLIAEPQWEEFGYFSGNADLAPVKKGGLWGYINKSGEVVVEYDYSDAYISKDCMSYDAGDALPAVDDYICLMKDGYLAGMYDTGTNEFSAFSYRVLVPVGEKYCIAKDAAGKWFYAEYVVIYNYAKML